MSNKYFDGVVENANVIEPVDEELKAVVTSARDKVTAKMNEFRVSDAISEILNVFRRANKYIDETMPWALAKDPEKADRLKTVLYNLVESIVIGTSLLAPFIPDTCAKVSQMIGEPLRDFDNADKFGLIEKLTVTKTPEILFQRLDAVKVMEEVNKMIEERKEKVEEVKVEQKPSKPQIEFDDFAKIELKIAKVIACEKVEKSKKLLKLTVQLGEETRTVVSGIANAYTPEYLIGKKLMMVTNLKPAKLCGIVSEGMICCAENDKGEIAFLTPEKDIEDGSLVY
jgi:methionyl-tRNA synthetase